MIFRSRSVSIKFTCAGEDTAVRALSCGESLRGKKIYRLIASHPLSPRLIIIFLSHSHQVNTPLCHDTIARYSRMLSHLTGSRKENPKIIIDKKENITKR
jgi:hypothetical protein